MREIATIRHRTFEQGARNDILIAALPGALTPLVLLACPVGMGLMMWMMARGSKKDKQSDRQALAESPTEPVSLELLREEHRRLSEQIDRLQRPKSSTIESAQRQ